MLSNLDKRNEKVKNGVYLMALKLSKMAVLSFFRGCNGDFNGSFHIVVEAL